MSSEILSPAQAHALFDILTHHETYDEILQFKQGSAIHAYGPPFKLADNAKPESPILQILLSKFALTLPGLRDVSREFWQERIQALVERFGDADLSESYDRGSIGSRKVLATATSVLIEYPARGCLGGHPRKETSSTDREYDLTKAEDIMQGWDDFVQAIVYGDLIDECFEEVAKTNRIEDHRPVVRAAHEYLLVNFASFLHHILILSPDGKYILRIIENIHKLIPYTIVRQTLRVGNAATMISGMVRLVLAKLSVNTITNWMGISKDADEGMNLLQQIISTVMSWDSSEFQKRATKIEKDKSGPSKEHLEAIRNYTKLSKREQDSLRVWSQESSKSIVGVIFESSNLPALPAHQHALALEYLSMLLNVRDREELTRILCRSNPDLLTQAVRDLVSAYEPIIRAVHNAVDLSATVADFEAFLNDLLALCKAPPEPTTKPSTTSPKDTNPDGTPETHYPADTPTSVPTVPDFVALLKRHAPSAHTFLHQVAKNGPDVTSLFQAYAHDAARQFRGPAETHHLTAHPASTAHPTDQTLSTNGAGAMTTPLADLLSSLAPPDRATVLHQLDAHRKYLAHLVRGSRARMSAILSSTKTQPGPTPGPGIYLARWQGMLDRTPLTPDATEARVRSGRDEVADTALGRLRKGRRAGRRDREALADVPEPSDVGEVVRLLGPGFKEVLGRGVVV